MANRFPIHNRRISGEEVKQPTASANIFVIVEISIAGPTSLSTWSINDLTENSLPRLKYLQEKPQTFDVQHLHFFSYRPESPSLLAAIRESLSMNYPHLNHLLIGKYWFLITSQENLNYTN